MSGPQSVVVPVDLAETPAIRNALGLYRSAILCGEQWSDTCKNAYLAALKELDQLAMLAAAPALAGGGDSALKVATDLHAAYEALIYGLPKYLEAKGLTDEENVLREAWIKLDVTAHRLAALSPEAPAREGLDAHQTVGPIDYDKLRSIIHSATNAVLPFADAPMKVPFSTQERAGMQVEIADLIVADLEKAGGRTPALTPRHEAPAEGAGEFARQMEILRKAASVPVPDDDSDFTVEKARSGSESWRVIASNVLREYDSARSSAPEAREGEAVAWRMRPNDGLTYDWAIVQTDPNGTAKVRADLYDVQPLFTHPAARSTDKLRELVGASEDILSALSALSVAGKPIASLDTKLRDAINTLVPALAALQAEQKGGAA